MEESDCNVELKPFGHQIAGHNSILRLDNTTICKLFWNREHIVYSNCPEKLRPFLPTFRGSLSVYCTRNNDGNICFWGKASELTDVLRKKYDDADRICDSVCNGSEVNNVECDPSPKVAQSNIDAVHVNNGHHDAQTPTGDVSWSLSCVQREMSLGRLKTDNSSKKYIVLDNLVADFSIPCMMDLKIGTQQHGDDVTEEKRNYQITKCLNTTSSSLGLRICGTQKFDATSCSLVRHDKYFGRQVTKENFSKTIYQHFHNGVHLRKDVLSAVLHRLHNMHDVIKEMNGWRFYGCSLLLIYEGREEPNSSLDSQSDALFSSTDAPIKQESGDSTNQDERVNVDVRLIDFAQNSCPGEDIASHNGPDEGFLFGMENFKTILKDILQEI